MRLNVEFEAARKFSAALIRSRSTGIRRSLAVVAQHDHGRAAREVNARLSPRVGIRDCLNTPSGFDRLRRHLASRRLLAVRTLNTAASAPLREACPRAVSVRRWTSQTDPSGAARRDAGWRECSHRRLNADGSACDGSDRANESQQVQGEVHAGASRAVLGGASSARGVESKTRVESSFSTAEVRAGPTNGAPDRHDECVRFADCVVDVIARGPRDDPSHLRRERTPVSSAGERLKSDQLQRGRELVAEQVGCDVSVCAPPLVDRLTCRSASRATMTGSVMSPCEGRPIRRLPCALSQPWHLRRTERSQRAAPRAPRL